MKADNQGTFPELWADLFVPQGSLLRTGALGTEPAFSAQGLWAQAVGGSRELTPYCHPPFVLAGLCSSMAGPSLVGQVGTVAVFEQVEADLVCLIRRFCRGSLRFS